METVESNRNPDLGHLRRIADYLREEGFGFALDDVGADAGALQLVSELRPDYIKLEKHLVHRMEQPKHAAGVRRLVEMADRMNVRVVAKGVERVSIMQRLQAAGVQCMQGYLFGSPAPEMAIPIDLAHLANYAASQVDTGFSLSDRARFDALRESSRDASSCPPESTTQDLQLESPVHSHAGR